MIQRLSIIIPAYNEEKTIAQVLEIICKLELIQSIQKEILVINDFSSDNTRKLVEEFIQKNPTSNVQLFNQKINKGKGAALHYGIQQASGDFLIPQDADLELDPKEDELLILKRREILDMNCKDKELEFLKLCSNKCLKVTNLFEFHL